MQNRHVSVLQFIFILLFFATLAVAAVVSTSTGSSIPSSSVSSSMPSASSLVSWSSVPHDVLQSMWSSLLDQFSPFAMSTYIPFLALVGSYVLFTTPIMVMETLDVQWLKKYKIQKKIRNSRAMLMKCVKELLFGYFCIMLPLIIVGQMIGILNFSFSTPVPPLWQILLDVAACCVIEDTCHFWFHWGMHHPKIYKYIHAVHHEFTAPFAVAASYAHPVEVIVLGLATFAGPLLLSPHLLTFLIWVNVRQLLAVETHCGYDFPWSPNNLFPGYFGGADFHDFHHRTFNGAYSSTFVWWDEFMNTEKGYLAFKYKKMAKGENVCSGDYNVAPDAASLALASKRQSEIEKSLSSAKISKQD